MNELFFLLQVGAIVFIVKGSERLGAVAMVLLSALLAVLANFFVLKQINLFGWSVTCSDAYVIGHLMCLNRIQQTVNHKTAQKAVMLSFAAMLVFVLLSQIHLLYLPSQADLTHGHYQALLGAAPRLFAASLATFYCVQRLDLFLFGKIAKLLPRVSWKFRSAFVLVIAQAVDTLLFTLLGLYGVVEDWIAIFWMSFVIKCSVIGIMTLVWREGKEVNFEV